MVFSFRAYRAVRTASVIAAAARGSDPRLPLPFPSSAPHPSSGPRARPSDPRPLLPRSPLRFIPRISLSLSTPRLLESPSSASPLCPTADTGPLLPSVPLGTDQLSYRNSSVPRDGGLPNPLDLTVDRVTDASRLRGCFQRISAVEPKGSSVVTCYCTTISVYWPTLPEKTFHNVSAFLRISSNVFMKFSGTQHFRLHKSHLIWPHL